MFAYGQAASPSSNHAGDEQASRRNQTRSGFRSLKGQACPQPPARLGELTPTRRRRNPWFMSVSTATTIAAQILSNTLAVLKSVRERAKVSKDAELKSHISELYDRRVAHICPRAAWSNKLTSWGAPYLVVFEMWGSSTSTTKDWALSTREGESCSPSKSPRLPTPGKHGAP